MMNQEEFDKSIKQWIEAPREEKTEFYDLFLWSEVRRRFEEQHSCLPGRFDVLVIPVSNPHTAILHLDYYRPETVVFLYTEKSRQENEERLKQETQNLGISYDDNSPDENIQRDIDPVDPISVYQAVKEVYLRYPDKHIGVDITGGTKAMSVGVAMAGSVIGANSIYIESKFFQGAIQYRIPGTEQPHSLPDPYNVLGDIDRKRALELYSRHDYATAHTLFKGIARRVQPPQGDEHWAHLSAAYDAWDSFTLDKAERELNWLCDNINDRPSSFIEAHQLFGGHRRAIERIRNLIKARRPQRDDPDTWQPDTDYESAVRRFVPQQIVRLTKTGVVATLVAMLYANAMRRESQKRHDMAALLLYRCLELMSQLRLARNGVLTEFPHDGMRNLKRAYGEEELTRRYNSVVQRVRPRSSGLPTGRFHLFDGYGLLQAIDDPFALRCDLSAIDDQIDIRNESIFAHGFSFISPRSYSAFKKTVDEVRKYWCEVEKLNWESYLEECTFFTYKTKAEV